MLAGCIQFSAVSPIAYIYTVGRDPLMVLLLVWKKMTCLLSLLQLAQVLALDGDGVGIKFTH